MQIENVSLTEIIAAARDRHASLVPESAGYLLLGVIRAMGGRPIHADPGRIVLGTDGGVAIAGQRKRNDADCAAGELQLLLRRLLDVSQGKGAALQAIADGPIPSLEGFFTAITKSLIPINRGAAKRALGRLARETLRARSRGLLAIDDTIEPSPEPALVRPRPPLESAPPMPAPSVAETARPIPSPEPTMEPAPSVPTPAVEVVVEEPALEWEDIDADIALATPTPPPARHIELETPVPHAALQVVIPMPVIEVTAAPAEPTVEAQPDPELPLLLTRTNEPAPVSVMAYEAPFIPVTPPPSLSEYSPSPGGWTSATPTIVDGTLYVLSTTAVPPPLILRLDEDPFHALSVELPPSEPEEPTPPPADEVDALGAEPLEVDIDFSDAPPLAEAAKAEAEPAPVREPELSDIEKEARLAQRLLALVNGPPREPAKPGSVEHLLERFGASDETDAVNEAAASLKRLMSLDLTPPPPDQEILVEMTPHPPSHREEAVLDAVPSISPPPVDARDSDARLTPTALTTDRPQGGRRALAAGSVALVLAAGTLAFLFVRHPETLGLSRDASEAQPSAAGADTTCYADLTLKDLPSPHEVLLGLGQAPMTTRGLPVGVRLELVALAPGYQPERVLVPSHAEWVVAPDGSRSMSLGLALQPGETNTWPAAPAGEVGGIGPSGIIALTAKPAGAEIWLVVGAGDGDRRPITVPCSEPATLLVVNPLDPAQRRRVTVAPNQLEAARSQGGAELSVKP